MAAEPWTPSPVRRVLLEPVNFFYGFGNTKYASLFRETYQASQKVLLLGFGDLRNALATAQDWASQPNTKLQTLELVLNDVSLLNVARGVLLAHLVESLNPSKEDDICFLWGVWYCLKLPAAWRLRLQEAISQLSQGAGAEEALRHWVPREADMQAVLKVFQQWAGSSTWPSVPKLESARWEHLRSFWGKKLEKGKLTAAEMEAAIQNQAGALVASAMSIGHPDWSVRESQGLSADLETYFRTGSIYPSAVSAATDAPDREGGGWEVNPTLLDLDTGAWSLHYGSSPFLSYFPLGPEAKPKELAQPYGLTQACLGVLTSMVRGWQACRAERSLSMHFMLGDALQLCQYGLEAESFSVVDTSNLADHVGLLNVLTCVPRVLQRSPYARLFTGTMTWPTAARRLAGYLEMALGVDPRLFPTIFGLRLLNDPKQEGRQFPHNLLSSAGMRDVSDTLEWMPAVQPSLKPQLQVEEAIGSCRGGDLVGALRSLCKRCCAERKQGSKPSGERCALQLPSTLTLLCLLGEVAQRVEGIVPLAAAVGGRDLEPDWRLLADHTARLVDLPPSYRIQWDALCCWACSDTLRQAEGRQGSLRADRPWVASADLQVAPLFQEVLHNGGTPLILAELASVAGQAGLTPNLSAMMAAMATDFKRFLHPMDVASYAYKSHRLQLLLPPDEPSRPLAPSVAAAPGNGSCGSTTNGGGPAAIAAAGAAAAKLSPGVSLRSITETADCWEVVLGFDPGMGPLSSSGLRVEFKGLPATGWGSSHTVKLEFSNPKAAAELPFAWPVDAKKYHVKVSRGKREVHLSLTKNSVWPLDKAWLPRVTVDGLKVIPSGEDSSLGIHLSSMFSAPENQRKAQNGGAGSGDTLFDVKETLQILFVRHSQGHQAHQLYGGAYSEQRQEAALSVFTHSLLALPDGRPLLHVSYVDHVVADEVLATPSQRERGGERFMRVLSHAGKSGHSNTVSCTPQEIDAIRVLLARNSLQLQVPSWQRILLDLPSEWNASFLLPLYSDYIAEKQEADDFVGLMGELRMGNNSTPPRQLRSMPATASEPRAREASPAVAGSSRSARTRQGRNTAQQQQQQPRRRASQQPRHMPPLQQQEEQQQLLALARNMKERGNAFFKQGQYRAAADQYLAGGAFCFEQAQGERTTAGAVEWGGLALDFSNNLAMALLKVAEAPGTSRGEAKAALQQAETACSSALEVDPANPKALYRRAQARLRLRKPQLALADLQKLPESSDAAVERLREQVKDALRP
ncbi:hypothetical protein N2152v2_006467 [Parachlorella kessleri]